MIKHITRIARLSAHLFVVYGLILGLEFFFKKYMESNGSDDLILSAIFAASAVISYTAALKLVTGWGIDDAEKP